MHTKALTLISLLAVLLWTACGEGHGTPNRPSSSGTGSFLLAADQFTSNLQDEAIGNGGILPSSPTAVIATGVHPMALAPFGANVYVLNSASNSVSQFTVGSTGSINQPAAAVSTEFVPVALTLDATQKFLIVANQVSQTLSLFSVATNGTLQPLAGSLAAVPLTLSPLALTFAASRLFVASSTEIQGFQFNSDTGVLTALPGSPTFLGGGANLTSLLADSTGTHLFATDQATNSVLRFSINSTTGALTSLPSSPVGAAPVAMTTDSARNFLYVVNSSSNNVSALSISATGTLATVNGSPFATGLIGANIIAFDPNDRLLFVGSEAGKQISVFDVNSNSGVLTRTSTSPFNVSFSPTAIAVVRP